MMTTIKPSTGLTMPTMTNVEITLAMARSAQRKQCHHSAVVRQGVERAGADHGDAVHQGRVDAGLRGDGHVIMAECVAGYGQSAGGPAGQRGEHVGRHRE